jgi:hypothetical protein
MLLFGSARTRYLRPIGLFLERCGSCVLSFRIGSAILPDILPTT